MQAVVPFLEHFQSLPSTSDIPLTIDANSILVSDTIAQDYLWDALEKEKENWELLRNSREYRLVERQREQCEAMIKSIAAVLKEKIGILGLTISDPTDLDIATSVVFDDLFDRFETQAKRKAHLTRVLLNIGNERSPVWRAFLKDLKRFL
ncbi:UNVERIFIED_CONTAM: hypothetical protein Slati_4524800 [Sesamum latifolium]|uniref:Uncharacterized protein n=1 Tax=Sesamum latifolium TaxID=2727402 RepID=A0AAW2SIW1_9LAMI